MRNGDGLVVQSGVVSRMLARHAQDVIFAQEIDGIEDAGIRRARDGIRRNAVVLAAARMASGDTSA